RSLRAYQFVEDAGPLAHPVRPTLYREINNFYTATVYEKGAEVVRMLKVLLGAENFRKGMDLYFSRHDGEAATVEQFVQCFADIAGADLAQFMLWYSQAGTPEVVASGSYDAGAKTYRLKVVQSVPATPGQPKKQPIVIPLALGLVGRDGRELPLKLRDGQAIARNIITLTEPVETFFFANPHPARRNVRVREHRPASGSFDQPRIFRANQGFSKPLCRRSAVPRRARCGSLQSLAGVADAGHPVAGRQYNRFAHEPCGAARSGPAGRARRDAGRGRARTGLYRPCADASGRSGHRARDRP